MRTAPFLFVDRDRSGHGVVSPSPWCGMAAAAAAAAAGVAVKKMLAHLLNANHRPAGRPVQRVLSVSLCARPLRAVSARAPAGRRTVTLRVARFNPLRCNK